MGFRGSSRSEPTACISCQILRDGGSHIGFGDYRHTSLERVWFYLSDEAPSAVSKNEVTMALAEGGLNLFWGTGATDITEAYKTLTAHLRMEREHIT